MKISRLLFLCALLPFTVLANLSRDEAAALCHEATNQFTQGNDLAAKDHAAAADLWRKAAARLERVTDEGGISSGPLFYNLGNIYFRIGDVGRAILSYRRAQLYMPNDRNLRANLEFARRARQDNVQTQESTRVLKTLFFWHYDFSLRLREGLFLGFACAFFLLGTIRVFWRRNWLCWVMGVAICLAVLFGASLGISEWSLSRHRPGVILDSEVVARKGDSDSYDRAFEDPLHAGTEFTLDESRGAWLNIRLADGQQAWIPAASAGLVKY